MFKSDEDSISERRFLLQNPYAYMEQLEARQVDLCDDKQSQASETEISNSRKLLQNQYAYLDGTGNFSALADRHSGKSSTATIRKVAKRQSPHAPRNATRYSDNAIEAKVRELHQRIWRERESIWPGAVPSDPMSMLNPIVAIRVVGYEYQLSESLGQYPGAGGQLEVAGVIDQSSKTIHISSRFPNNVRAFTAAHELGHAVLHPSASGVHRDRPVNGASLSREISEIEADRFATLFLMPAKLVQSRFAQVFKVNMFSLNEDTSFALAGISPQELQGKYRTRRDFSRLLASAKRYDGRHFESLADQFGVSTESMAIRLEELDMVPVDI